MAFLGVHRQRPEPGQAECDASPYGSLPEVITGKSYGHMGKIPNFGYGSLPASSPYNGLMEDNTSKHLEMIKSYGGLVPSPPTTEQDSSSTSENQEPTTLSLMDESQRQNILQQYEFVPFELQPS